MAVMGAATACGRDRDGRRVFLNGLREGLTVEIKLRFQISSALCERDLRFRYDYEQIKPINVKAITTTKTRFSPKIWKHTLSTLVRQKTKLFNLPGLRNWGRTVID